MQLGMIGLGRMGSSMVRRLLKGGHACVVFDSELTSVTKSAQDGARGASSLDELVKHSTRRA
jgi:6-phosphogluconate dehydrogenase